MPRSRRPRPTLSSTRRDFDRWRSRRSPGQRIPTDLWSAAASLAREHGVSVTSRELGLDYYDLKRRAEVEPAVVPAATAAARALPEPAMDFIEVTLPSVGTSPACTVELDDGHGTRLRVKLEGEATRRGAEIACALWSAARPAPRATKRSAAR